MEIECKLVYRGNFLKEDGSTPLETIKFGPVKLPYPVYEGTILHWSSEELGVIKIGKVEEVIVDVPKQSTTVICSDEKPQSYEKYEDLIKIVRSK